MRFIDFLNGEHEMKLTEIHALTKGPGGRPYGEDAEYAFEFWYDENYSGLNDARDKFPDYAGKQRSQAVNHIVDQVKDYVNDKVFPGISKNKDWYDRVMSALEGVVEDALGN